MRFGKYSVCRSSFSCRGSGGSEAQRYWRSRLCLMWEISTSDNALRLLLLLGNSFVFKRWPTNDDDNPRCYMFSPMTPPASQIAVTAFWCPGLFCAQVVLIVQKLSTKSRWKFKWIKIQWPHFDSQFPSPHSIFDRRTDAISPREKYRLKTVYSKQTSLSHFFFLAIEKLGPIDRVVYCISSSSAVCVTVAQFQKNAFPVRWC